MTTTPTSVNFEPEPDVHPLYPSPAEVSASLSPGSSLSPEQKHVLISHCMTRACFFADLAFFQHILHDPHAKDYLDLNTRDEDGLVYISVIIHGFGSESDRDLEREECVRLLVAEGADVNANDKAGWTPLHHAALLAPPTLISFLLTHGCSPLSETTRHMTALDLVTAYGVIPGREDVALFLEEAMKGEGWEGSKLSVKRRQRAAQAKQGEKRRSELHAIDKILELEEGHWWSGIDLFERGDGKTMDEGYEKELDSLYTPPLDYSSMLVFSLATLPGILDSLILNYRPSVRNQTPANALYMLSRFACLACDHTWLEELVLSATDAIEDAAFNHADDLTHTVFWLYNCTVWLHLMRCDQNLNETCELLGSFDVVEEVINTVYVLIIRVAERRIDRLIDTALLEFSPADAGLHNVEFEPEWSLFRSPFGGKKRASAGMASVSTIGSFKHGSATPGKGPSRPTSPDLKTPHTTSPKAFSSIRSHMSVSSRPSISLQNFVAEGPPPNHSPQELLVFLSALHTLLSETGINPAIITQLWSQVMYWTASEAFNRILTRKKYLCRSRALQIGMNMSLLEEWISDVGLPHGVVSHLTQVKELLLWLQCLSSMDDFSNLIATMQTLKHLNPLQMRRAVRDYKYELNEPRMSEDCSQYLAQLQKDWERQRVRMGVEALRKEIPDRSEESDSFIAEMDEEITRSSNGTTTPAPSDDGDLNNVDSLFNGSPNKTEWQPLPAPEVLGELLESRYLHPLSLPSDPRMLAAVPGRMPDPEPFAESATLSPPSKNKHTRNLSRVRTSERRVLDWVTRTKSMRQVTLDVLDCVDGCPGTNRWIRRADAPPEPDGSEHENASVCLQSANGTEGEGRSSPVHLTQLARSSSTRHKKGRSS